MRIKALRQPPRPGARLTVLFEDGTVLRVVPAVAAELGLCAGQELTDEAMEQLRAKAGAASAKARAVAIIGASAVSKRELEHRLIQKGETASDAQAAVAWLDELKLLNDAETAEQIVRRGVARGYGRGRIEQMLYEKRIPKQYWDAALAQIPDMSGEIDRFIRKRLGDGPLDRKTRQQLTAALARRGFDWQQIRAGLQRWGDSCDWNDEE